MYWIIEWLLNKEKNKKKSSQKVRFMKIIVTFVIVANCLFATGVLFVFYKIGLEPTVLIGSWFTFTTVELLSLAKLRRSENESDDYDVYDEKGDF